MHSEIKIFPATTTEQTEIVRLLFVEYQQSLNFSLCFQGFDQELATLPGKYSPPNGRLYLAECDNTIAGCIALRPMEENGVPARRSAVFPHAGVCEMKRLFVRKEFRGKGIGKILKEKIIADAKQIGYHTMRLDSLQRMETARSLYKKLGFIVIPAYYNNPLDEVVYMEMNL
ncbi:MAG: GNAT family N-acetyltransferase [Bacteroidota bacterium]|nr:GNAT family N-acetyltransferase [Bacteroidota bacterium]